MDMGAWYLISCKYGRIKKAEESLSLIGVKTFCPMMKCEKKRTGSNSPRVTFEPMFPPYLFINFHPEVVHTSKINTSPGVGYFVRFGSEPKPLPQSLLDALMLKSSQSLSKNSVAHLDDKKTKKIELLQAGDSQGLLNLLEEMIAEQPRLFELH